MCVYTGWRPAEALTVSTVAFHQTLTELLLCLARCAVNETDAAFAAAVRADLLVLPAILHSTYRLMSCDYSSAQYTM